MKADDRTRYRRLTPALKLKGIAAWLTQQEEWHLAMIKTQERNGQGDDDYTLGLKRARLLAMDALREMDKLDRQRGGRKGRK